MGKGWPQGWPFLFSTVHTLPKNDFRLYSINFYYIALEITPIPPGNIA